MKSILWFFKYGWEKDRSYGPTDTGDWRGVYGVWPKRGFTFNEGRGPINFALFYWPHLFFYLAIRWFGTWYRLSFDWSKP